MALVVSAEFLRVSGAFRLIIIGLAVLVLMGIRKRGLAGLVEAGFALLRRPRPAVAKGAE